MAIGKTNTGGGQKTYISYTESQNTTNAQKQTALANAGTMRIYKSVTELGLSTGTATLAGAWDAMSDGDALIADASEFATNQLPMDGSTCGYVEMIRSTNTRGRILYISKDVLDYRMFMATGGGPSGVWKCTSNVKVSFSSVSSLPQTVNTGNAHYVTSTMEVLSYTLSNPAAQTGDWTITTADQSVSVSGTISGTTNIDLILGEVM